MPGDTTLVILVTTVILERPTCLVCLCSKVGADQLSVVRVMERIGRTVDLQVERNERCRACGSTVGPVYSVTRRAEG